MRVEIEDFKTGWFGLTVGIKNSEVDLLINALKKIKNTKGHFHFRSDHNGSGGVADIEFYAQNEDEPNNMELDSSPAKYSE